MRKRRDDSRRWRKMSLRPSFEIQYKYYGESCCSSVCMNASDEAPDLISHAYMCVNRYQFDFLPGGFKKNQILYFLPSWQPESESYVNIYAGKVRCVWSRVTRVSFPFRLCEFLRPSLPDFSWVPLNTSSVHVSVPLILHGRPKKPIPGDSGRKARDNPDGVPSRCRTRLRAHTLRTI